MLTLDQLTVDIQGSRILRGISLAVKPGELVCLIGRNGAGKTTTFKSIMGFLRPVAGQIRFGDRSISGLRPYQIAALGIGYAPEESEVFGELTVAENIEMPTWTRTTGRSSAERIATAYEVFPKLKQYASRGGTELSGGERKMVSVARALALDPTLLLLDEPFEGLSPAIIPSIAAGIDSIRARGHAILIAESNVHHLPESTDWLCVIERGEMIFTGRPAQARERPDVMRVIAA
jgi:branched-chain amino acid transport system ATP-binding protein